MNTPPVVVAYSVSCATCPAKPGSDQNGRYPDPHSQAQHWKLLSPELRHRHPQCRHRGMHLTPETPTYSMRGCGGLPADAGGV